MTNPSPKPQIDHGNAPEHVTRTPCMWSVSLAPHELEDFPLTFDGMRPGRGEILGTAPHRRAWAQRTQRRPGRHNMEIPCLLTIDEAATRLSLSPRMIYRLIGSGDLPSCRIGASRRIKSSAIAAYIAGL